MFGRNTGKLLKGPTMGAHTINHGNESSVLFEATYVRVLIFFSLSAIVM